MNKNSANRIINVYLKKKFNYFFIKKRLSDFAFTFNVIGDGKHYVIKLIERKNVVSNIVHDKKHVSRIVLASSLLGNNGKIFAISVIDYFLSEEYSILLLKKEKISKIKIDKKQDFKTISQAIFNFHSTCKDINFKKLPWNNFPRHFKEALRRNSRWSIVDSFIRKNAKYIDRINIVSCHNDIHAGNVYYLRKKIIFLDLDDMCRSSYFNDLGMLLANFMNSNYSSDDLLKTITNIFKGYNLKMSRTNILNISIFSLRKLYFTEAYFLYANKKNAQLPRFVCEIRKREDIIKNFMESYL